MKNQVFHLLSLFTANAKFNLLPALVLLLVFAIFIFSTTNFHFIILLIIDSLLGKLKKYCFLVVIFFIKPLLFLQLSKLLSFIF
jgi:hypothetical protein